MSDVDAENQRVGNFISGVAAPLPASAVARPCQDLSAFEESFPDGQLLEAEHLGTGQPSNRRRVRAVEANLQAGSEHADQPTTGLDNQNGHSFRFCRRGRQPAGCAPVNKNVHFGRTAWNGGHHVFMFLSLRQF